MKIFARNGVAMTSMATGSKVPSTHNIPRILHITSSPTPRGRDTTDSLCTFSDLLWRDLCLRMEKLKRVSEHLAWQGNLASR